MVDTAKNDHWQSVVLTPTGVVPGTFNLAQVTVGEDGRITNIANGTASVVSTVNTIGDLPTIASPSNGQLAIVLDDGSANEQLYIWNNTNSDLGAPLNRWRLAASTDVVAQPFGFRQSTINQASSQNIGAPVPDTGIIKEVTIEITTPYSPGTTIEIQDNSAFVYMPFSDVNPELVGIYTTDLSGNLNDIQTNSGPGQGQIKAIVGGAPGAGNGVVYLTFVQP